MNNQQREPEKMTRQQYREWQKQQSASTMNDGDPRPSMTPSDEELKPRQAVKKDQQLAIQEAKTTRLKRRLNWTILGLCLAIIIVYLILFFVG